MKIPSIRVLSCAAALVLFAGSARVHATQARTAQTPIPDWANYEAETLRHYQALLRFDTTDPPGNERPAADYLRQTLEKEGIATSVFTLEPNRPNVVARIKGSGRKRPLLIMAHTDVVTVDPAKWKFPPFSATRDGGWVYGRGTLDDKDNVASALMVALTLKRLNVPLDRDVIFLFESGEEGTTRVGIQFMANQHFAEIDAEYCLAEGGAVTRQGGRVRYASVQTLEKNPRAIELTATGVAGHASVPLQSNAVVHLAQAVAKLADWKTQIRINDTTGAYFARLAEISTPEEARRYRDVVSGDPRRVHAAEAYFSDKEPRHSSMLRTSLSPTQFNAGYRVNVIPSEAKAVIDVRMLPDENAEQFLSQARAIVNDPAVQVNWLPRDLRPGASSGKLDNEAFKTIEANITKHYQAPTLPTMGTGATDMSYLRAKGVQCYGIGPAADVEDGPLGFGAHSDQERLLESELHRFAKFNWDVVVDLAGVK